VRATGALALVQDAGRPGSAHLGVTRSGAADSRAFEAANRLVGNLPGAACIESVLGGVSMRATSTVLVAVTGAATSVLVEPTGPVARHGSGGRGIRGTVHPTGYSFTVFAGETFTVRPPSRGLRNYVAVRGGIDVEPVLGSRSTDVLSGLGPTPLAAGDVVKVGRDWAEWPAAECIPPERARCADATIELRLHRGPRDDWFGEQGWVVLTGAAWTVGAQSNRVGVRLEGGGVLERLPGFAGELPSEGMVAGAVQVPPSGQPVVFLRDHPVTGGYPVVGVLTAASIDALAQLRPGEEVRLRGV
jgi:biotin-dependent carboxylase-like uncharacterized protein